MSTVAASSLRRPHSATRTMLAASSVRAPAATRSRVVAVAKKRSIAARRGVARRDVRARADANEDVSSSVDDSVARVDNEEETTTAGDAVEDVNIALGDLISSPLFYVTFGVAGGVFLVKQLGENASFLLSAAPVVLLTAISKTEFGANLVKNIEDKRPMLEAEKAKKERERAEARAKSPYYGADRAKFLPFDGYDFPEHLDGSLCGDVGFDPLGLGREPENMEKYRELELLHARWAMLGVVGVAVPEVLDRAGVADLGEPVWWCVGAAKMNSDIALDYLGMGGFHIAGGSGIAIIAACQLVLMGGPEYARYVGIESLIPVGVYLPGDINYPGGAPFDPFKMSDDAEEFEKQKVMEIKHGRLAMIAMLGCFAQALATKQGPIENVASLFN